MNTTDDERFSALRERLSRQMKIAELGEDGERRIVSTRFLVIGAGGLGSPALMYLAAAGACHLTVVDPDEVSENNLSRQVLHDAASIGRNKAENAARELVRWNPELDVRAVPARMNSPEDLAPLVREADIVLDCSDNLATRQLAKRQLTWLRSMEDVVRIDPLGPGGMAAALDALEALLGRILPP